MDTRRTVTNTADRLRINDVLVVAHQDEDFSATIPTRWQRVFVVDIAACADPYHLGCLAVAVADPDGAMTDYCHVVHTPAGLTLTWTGNYAEVDCVGHRPGYVDRRARPAQLTDGDTLVEDIRDAPVVHTARGPVQVMRIDRTAHAIGLRLIDGTYLTVRRGTRLALAA